MKITICGSTIFARDMYEANKSLINRGHEVFLPEFVVEFVNGKLGYELGTLSREEGAKKKKKYDLIRKHYNKIKESDAILVINNKKNETENYIGANTLIEIAFAYILDKKIYLLNDLPEFDYLLEEVKAMEPIILNGDLRKIE